MQRAETLRTAAVASHALPHVSVLRNTLTRAALTTLALAYLGVILLAPLLALLHETAALGFDTALSAVLTADALAALGMSAQLVVIAVVVNGAVGTLGALVIVRHRFVGRRLLSALFDLPLAVSPVMVGLGFLLLAGRDGVLAPGLAMVGIEVMFSPAGLIVATLFVTLPYTLREVAYVLEELGTSEEEAATTLGASPMQTFMRVTLPNIRVALGYGLLMTAARTLGEFGAVLVLGGSIAGQTQTATTFIHDALEERAQAGAYGMALVLAATSVVWLMVLELAKRRRQPASAGRVGR